MNLGLHHYRTQLSALSLLGIRQLTILGLVLVRPSMATPSTAAATAGSESLPWNSMRAESSAIHEDIFKRPHPLTRTAGLIFWQYMTLHDLRLAWA